MKNKLLNISLCVMIFLLTLSIYLPTIAPSITWQHNGADSGELAAAVATMGIAHPPGYPTYILLGRAWITLPLGGDVAYRLNLLSASAGALSAALSMATIILLARNAWPRVYIGAFFGGLVLAFAPLIWSQAIITEVYVPGLAMLSLTTFLLMWWQQSAKRNVLALAGLVGGLALGILPQLILIVPGLLALLYAHFKRSSTKTGVETNAYTHLRALLQPLLAVALGVSTYLYLPLRATMTPRSNWGDPITVERFWQLITAQQYQHFVLGLGLEGWLARLGESMILLASQIGWIGLVPAIFGAAWLWHQNRPALGYLLSLIVLTLLFRTSYPAFGNQVYLIPAIYGLALLIGVGLAIILASTKGHMPAILLIMLMLTLLTWRGISIGQQMDLSHDQSATRFTERVLNALPSNAILVSERDESTFSLWYQQALGKRLDVVVIDSRLLFYDWYQEHLVQLYPDLNPAAVRPGGLTALERPIYIFVGSAGEEVITPLQTTR